MEKIKCTKCKVDKSRNNFRERKGTKSGLQYWCKECENEAQRNRYKPKPKKINIVDKEKKKYKDKIRMLKWRYNMTINEYNKIYEQQNFSCAICEEKYELGGFGGLYVDHCHEKNIVRGLLCNNCNSALGKFNDNVELLKKAIAYLEKN